MIALLENIGVQKLLLGLLSGARQAALSCDRLFKQTKLFSKINILQQKDGTKDMKGFFLLFWQEL